MKIREFADHVGVSYQAARNVLLRYPGIGDLKKVTDNNGNLTRKGLNILKTHYNVHDESDQDQEEDVNQLRKKVADLIDQITDLNKVISDGQSETDQLQQTITNLKSQITDKDNLITNLTDKVTDLKDQITDLKDQVTDWRQRFDILQSQATADRDQDAKERANLRLLVEHEQEIRMAESKGFIRKLLSGRTGKGKI